ncbi:MAG TPA: hypothetical protein VFG64_05285 [Dongiaceae bacterium]|nr:hypothetical protein [Dongiaceae bacterium]
MTRAMLLAVLDTLLPGEQGEPPLPRASDAALDLATLERLAGPVIAALGDGFLTASPAERAARLGAVEQAHPATFRPLLAEALAAYYQAAPVLAALGWRAAPPQPHGHDVAPTDNATLRLLETVRRRGRLWRG